MNMHLSYFNGLAVAAVLAASSLSAHAQAPTPAETPRNSTTTPQVRNPWLDAHERMSQTASEGNIDVLFVGDSITAGWTSPSGAGAIWKEHYVPLKAANFAYGGDRTENVLWRLQNGELKGFKAKVVVLLIGTNNLTGSLNTGPEVADGIVAIIKEIQKEQPQAKIILNAVFPRGEMPDTDMRKSIKEINDIISKLGDDKNIFFIDIGPQLTEPDGRLTKENTQDHLHLTVKGYTIWDKAIYDKIVELTKAN